MCVLSLVQRWWLSCVCVYKCERIKRLGLGFHLVNRVRPRSTRDLQSSSRCILMGVDFRLCFETTGPISSEHYGIATLPTSPLTVQSDIYIYIYIMVFPNLGWQEIINNSVNNSTSSMCASVLLLTTVCAALSIFSTAARVATFQTNTSFQCHCA